MFGEIEDMHVKELERSTGIGQGQSGGWKSPWTELAGKVSERIGTWALEEGSTETRAKGSAGNPAGWLAGVAGREEWRGQLGCKLGRILKAHVGNQDLCLIPCTTVNVSGPDMHLD